MGSLNGGGDCEKLYLDEEVSGCRKWDGTWNTGVCALLGGVALLDGEVQVEVLVQKKRLEGFDADKRNIEVDQVELVGELTMTHRMTDATWRAAVARNIM